MIQLNRQMKLAQMLPPPYRTREASVDPVDYDLEPPGLAIPLVDQESYGPIEL